MTHRQCAECEASSPETETQYTLIAKHGWRVSRVRGKDGEVTLEWRCPTCWTAYKARQPTVRTQPPPPPRASRPPLSPASHASAEAGRIFDRALEALATRPPAKPPR